ncbi:hypothetical protein D3C76_1528880 [compost metagenome]
MRLGLLDCQESMLSLTFIHQVLVFKMLQRKVQHVRRAKACFSYTPFAAIDHHLQRAKQSLGLRRCKAKGGLD